MRPASPPVRVLGIDPGTHVCGWGVVEREGSRLTALGYGVVRARATDPIEKRLAAIAAGLRDVVARHAPHAAAMEDVFYGRDARAAVRIGEGRGAALVLLADAGVPVAHYANNVVKRAVAGGGRADKARVQTMTRAILSLASLSGPLDASDALALAICHHHRMGAPASSATSSSTRSSGRGATAAGPGRLHPRVEAAIEAMRAAERARAQDRVRVRAVAGARRP